MAYTTEKHDNRVAQIVERDTGVAADAVRPEVVVRAPAGAAGVAVDTELPAAGALADGTANPTTPLVGGERATGGGRLPGRRGGDGRGGAPGAGSAPPADLAGAGRPLRRGKLDVFAGLLDRALTG